MKCPTCGTSASEVVDTRPWQNGVMLRRRRECFNGHRFFTFEVSERLAKTMDRYAKPSATGILQRGKLWQRDTTIVRKVTSGQRVTDVAAEYGLATNTVSWIVKRRAPEYNARSAGQKARAAVA